MTGTVGYTGSLKTIIDGKAPLASPAFTGTPTIGGVAVAKTTDIAALVNSAPGTLDTLGELAAALTADEGTAATLAALVGTKAPLASPAFTGTPTVAGSPIVTTSTVTAATATDVPVTATASLTGANVQAALVALAARIATLEAGTGGTTTPALSNTTAPTITGATTLGATLTVSTGSWSATPDSYTYVWKRDSAAITGATAGTYVIAAADQGHTVTVTVTATKAGYTSGTATSGGTAIPAGATPALSNTVAPAVTGTAQAGQTLTVSNGTWNATPDSYSYQWNRAGTPISGATAATYVPVTGDVGSTLTATVTATKAGYTTGSATSAATVTVTAAAGGGSGPTFTITDTFTRADGTALGTTETGSKTWTDNDGVCSIAGGVLRNGFGFGTGAILDVGAVDQTVEFTAVNGPSVQVYLRYIDGSNWLLIQGDGTILRTVAGAQTVDTTNGPTWANGDVVRVQLAGTAVTLSINGSQAKTWTTGVTTGTKFVMHNGQIDNFKAATP